MFLFIPLLPIFSPILMRVGIKGHMPPFSTKQSDFFFFLSVTLRMKTFFLSVLSFNWWRRLYNVVLASATQQCKSAIIIIDHLLCELLPSPISPLQVITECVFGLSVFQQLLTSSIWFAGKEHRCRYREQTSEHSDGRRVLRPMETNMIITMVPISLRRTSV